MKYRLGLVLCAALAVFTVAAAAADVSGKWTAEVPGREGQPPRTSTFTFKADGDTLTGTVAGAQGGETAISDGKIKGDEISFTVTREMGGNTVKLNYTGKVSDNEIKFKMVRDGGQGQAREFTAKKTTT